MGAEAVAATAHVLRLISKTEASRRSAASQGNLAAANLRRGNRCTRDLEAEVAVDPAPAILGRIVRKQIFVLPQALEVQNQGVADDLRARTMDGPITPGFHLSNGPCTRLSVKDRGVGIGVNVIVGDLEGLLRDSKHAAARFAKLKLLIHDLPCGQKRVSISTAPARVPHGSAELDAGLCPSQHRRA